MVSQNTWSIFGSLPMKEFFIGLEETKADFVSALCEGGKACKRSLVQSLYGILLGDVSCAFIQVIVMYRCLEVNSF